MSTIKKTTIDLDITDYNYIKSLVSKDIRVGRFRLGILKILRFYQEAHEVENNE